MLLGKAADGPDIQQIPRQVRAVGADDAPCVGPQQTAENGEIVVALLDDSATVKRFRKDGKQIWLLPENPAYDPIDGNQAQIIGKVKAVIRTY